ncbi:MAG: hypothetical protein U1G07_11425 [Verrucomicrobiota bacterium]
MADLFLDTELAQEDYRRIAENLARSPYSEETLWEIFRFEVYPACRRNLRVVAGEWAGFDRRWLIEKITPHFDKRPKFRWSLFNRWMLSPHWRKIQPLLHQLRAQERNLDQENEHERLPPDRK